MTNWLPRIVSSNDLKLPPRPGIRRLCPKCGILHTERKDVMECLADKGK